MATPSPLSRPALLRISERDRCPKMMATIDKGNANRKRPQTKLTIAFPLVCACTPTAGVVADSAATSLPQTPQNLSPAETSFPQPAQNTKRNLRNPGPIQESPRNLH